LRRQAELQSTNAPQGGSAFHANGSSTASSPLPGMLNANPATLFSSFAPGMSGLPSLEKQRNQNFTAAPQPTQPLAGIAGKRGRESETGGNGVNNFYGGATSLPAINFAEGLSPKQAKTENKESSFSLPMPVRPAEAAHPAEKPATKPAEPKRTEAAAEKEADWNVMYVQSFSLSSP